jgi:transposase
MGCQWKLLPIRVGPDGKPEIHYSRLHRALSFLEAKGIIDAIFVGSVKELHEAKKLDVSVIHGDGTSTAAKKGGDNLGYNGHKHFKGDKVVAFCDRNGNVIAPFVSAPGNQNESPLFREELPKVLAIARLVGFNLKGSMVSLDGVYDGKENRKAIFNHGMRPNIPENPRNRKTPKPGPKRTFEKEIFAERFFTIERVFAWEDKFKRLLLRFERRSELHYALKSLAYAMINLRHFCQA